MEHKTLIIFDLDGTLINSAPDVLNALNKTLAIYNVSPIANEEIYGLLGLGARVMIERALLKFNFQIVEDVIDKAVQHYLMFYQQFPVVNSYVYPYVYSVLNLLHSKQFRLAICTNKPNVMTQLVLEKMQLLNFFEIVSAGDQVAYAKPHRAHLEGILQQLNLKQHEALMVGDSAVDEEAAYNAGVDFIGVQYECTPHKIKFRKMMSSLAELPAYLGIDHAS